MHFRQHEKIVEFGSQTWEEGVLYISLLGEHVGVICGCFTRLYLFIKK